MSNDDRWARRQELLKLSKPELVVMVRRNWGGGGLPPERRTKDELAGDVADLEVGQEMYAAYGQVALLNFRPAPSTRPHCGGKDCQGHALPCLPWPEVRDRHRAGGPCVGPLPEPAGPAEAKVWFLRDHRAMAFEDLHTGMQFKAGDSIDAYRWRRPDMTVDETTWWTSPQDEARFAFEIPGDVVEVQ